MKKHASRIRFWRVPKWFMAVVLVLEIAALYQVLAPTTQSERGYLIKIGQNYVLGWRESDGSTHQSKYDDLRSALKFARENLRLLPGRNPLLQDEVEHLWVRSDIEGHVLYFKTLTHANLNRMTFASIDEARFFESVFRRGAYSPSPIGHSVNLIPFPH